MQSSTKSYIKIAVAGGLWGTIGILVQTLTSFGLTSEMVAFSRLFLGFIILTVIFALKDPSVLKIDRKGLFSSFVIGVISQGIFNIAYFQAIQRVGSFTAVVLLYLSPVFMFILGTFMYKEIPDKKKIISVGICFFGCILGVTGGDFSVLQSDFMGITMGIVASLGYSLMPALSKKTASKYNPFTIIIYSFMFGALVLLPFANPFAIIGELKNPSLILLLIVFSVVVAVLPYSLYIPSLHNVQVSKLGVIASVELIVSILIAAFILKEPIKSGNIAGASLIFLSIILMNSPSLYTRKERYQN